MEQGEAFLCWYCRAGRVASAAKLLVDAHAAGDRILQDEIVEILRDELNNFYYGGMSLSQLKKLIKGLEDDR